MLGQAQLTLRDVINFTKKNNFDVNFLEKVKVSLSYSIAITKRSYLLPFTFCFNCCTVAATGVERRIQVQTGQLLCLAEYPRCNGWRGFPGGQRCALQQRCVPIG